MEGDNEGKRAGGICNALNSKDLKKEENLECSSVASAVTRVEVSLTVLTGTARPSKLFRSPCQTDRPQGLRPCSGHLGNPCFPRVQLVPLESN